MEELTLSPIRLTKLYGIFEYFINQELYYKYRLRELINNYKNKVGSIQFEILKEKDKIKFSIEDFHKILKNTEKNDNEIELFFKDNENLKLKIQSYEIVNNFYELEIQNKEKLKLIPNSGEIYYNKFSGEEYQNNILLNALNDVKNLHNSNLRHFLRTLMIPLDQSKFNTEKFSDKLLEKYNPSSEQQLAMNLYNLNKDFFLITGDAGTGKTTTLLEIVKKAIDSGKRVLCLAQSHKIVDQYLNELKDHKKGHYLYCRLGKNEKKIQENLRDYSFEKFYKQSYKETLDLLEEKINDNKSDQQIKELQKDWREYLNDNFKIFKRLNLYAAEAVFSTTMGFNYYLKIFTKLIPFDLIIFDEGSLVTFSEFVAFLQYGKKWIIGGDDNQLHQFINNEFKNLVIPDEGRINRRFDWKSTNLINHLDLVFLENYIGLSTLRRFSSFRLKKEANRLTELKFKENFRLPNLIEDVFELAYGHPYIENVPEVIKNNLGNYIEFIQTDNLSIEGIQNSKGHSNNLEAKITIEKINQIIEANKNIKEKLIIGVGAAWNAQIDLISKIMIEKEDLFILEEGNRNYFRFKFNKNIQIIVDTFWSLASKNVDFLIWNFIKCKYRTVRNRIVINGDIFRGLYSENPNLFNCFLKRFKKKLIIIGNSLSYNKYIKEMKQYIEFSKNLIFLWREYITKYLSRDSSEYNDFINLISRFEYFINGFKKIYNVLYIFLSFSKRIIYQI